MKKSELRVGETYAAKVSATVVTVRLDAIRDGWGVGNKPATYYDVTNLHTGRKTTFRSAAKFRRPSPFKADKPVSRAAELLALLPQEHRAKFGRYGCVNGSVLLGNYADDPKVTPYRFRWNGIRLEERQAPETEWTPVAL